MSLEICSQRSWQKIHVNNFEKVVSKKDLPLQVHMNSVVFLDLFSEKSLVKHLVD